MRRNSKATADILIVGGGHAGLSLAAVLGAAGLDVVCLERGFGKPRGFDGRTLALSFRSMRVLAEAGVAPFIRKNACPILDIRVADQASPFFLDFDHREVGSEPFGWIIENHLFEAALRHRLRQLKPVRLVYDAAVEGLERSDEKVRVTLRDGRVFEASLIVGADGRKSRCRELAGISTYGWSYRQTAVVCVIKHSLPHNNVAVEHFQPGGPFATLPMTDLVPLPLREGLGEGLLPQERESALMARPPHLASPSRGGEQSRSRRKQKSPVQRSSIVWTEKTGAASALMAMDEDSFAAMLQEKVKDYLGEIEVIGERFAYPLTLQHAEHYTAERLALVGDAAHGIHPIAGQGFNLGMGDIEALAEEVIAAARLGLDAGSPGVLRRYEKRRKFDNGNMVLMTDLLDRLFSNAVPPVQALRRLGLGAVQRIPSLKRYFMRTAMGG